MDDSAFEARADAVLECLMERLEEAAGDVLEVDLENGVLSVTLDSGGEYLLNRHAPTAELWLSSPVSGAGHFAHDPATGGWRDRRGGDDLVARLERELSGALGRPLPLADPQ